MSDTEKLKKDIGLLEESKEKWWGIMTAGRVDRGGDDCPLCQVYNVAGGHCDACPVREKTGEPACDITPYTAWKRHMRVEHSPTNRKVKCPDCLKLAIDMYDFLDERAVELKVRLNDRLGKQKEQETPEPKLCYVDGPWAYFTTQSLNKQWGDDWNDAPYEHNAGTPYEYREHDKRKGRKPWRIVKVAWDGKFITPDYCMRNSKLSVENINNGAMPWLRFYDDQGCVHINSGTSLKKFCQIIRRNGGQVFLPDTLENLENGGVELEAPEKTKPADLPPGPLTYGCLNGRYRICAADHEAVATVYDGSVDSYDAETVTRLFVEAPEMKRLMERHVKDVERSGVEASLRCNREFAQEFKKILDRIKTGEGHDG